MKSPEFEKIIERRLEKLEIERDGHVIMRNLVDFQIRILTDMKDAQEDDHIDYGVQIILIQSILRDMQGIDED